ncbi:MAG: aminotransferase class I/II-fold pyridoxal phosphate-dependent enzyme, partial [Anaerolineae bacterium]
MEIAPFTIEQFFAVYEFSTPHLLCASDCETMTVAELLSLANMDLAGLGDLRLNYTESQGDPALRTAVAQQYPGIAPDEVVILTAPEEGIYTAMRTLLEPGDHVVVLTPAYDSLLNMAQHITGNVSKWEIQPTETGWRVDLEALAQLVTADTRLIVVNFPHNPTGFLPTESEFADIVDIARQNNSWLFCDEMYRGLELNGRAPLPSAATLYDRVIVLSGLSKTHGLPGLRCGWLVIRDEAVRQALINWKHYTSICPPGPSEFLAKAALSVRQQLADRSRAIIEKKLAKRQLDLAV